MSQETSVATADMGDSLRCGLCLEKLTPNTNAKQLPCSHVYCSLCLESDEEKICPACRQPWTDSAVRDLNLVLPDIGPSTKGIPCEACRLEMIRTANVYCVSCMKTFCDEHEMKHDELFDLQHDKVSISTYMKSPAQYRMTKCEEHSSQITVACELCHLVFCGKCDFNTECQGDWEVSYKGKTFNRQSNAVVDVEDFQFAKKLRKRRVPISIAQHNRLFFRSEAKDAFVGSTASKTHPPKTFNEVKNAQTFGKTQPRFVPVIGTDDYMYQENGKEVPTQHSTRHFCVSAMTQYETFSLEELRVGDYNAGAEKPPRNDTPYIFNGLKLQASGNTRPKAKMPHQFVGVAQFTAAIEEKLKEKLEILSDKKADIYKAEKTTWREVDDTENRVKRWEDQVDDTIKQKVQQLITVGDNFKEQIHNYSSHIGNKAAVFMEKLVTEEDRLMEVERKLSRALSAETDVIKLVALLHNTPDEVKPTAEFVVEQKSVKFNCSQPTFSLAPFLPSGLLYQRKQVTEDAIVALAATPNGKVLVGTDSNHLEIRNLFFQVLFREKVPGQLIDVATVDDYVACLLTDGERSTVYLYSIELKNAKAVCNWQTTCPDKERIAGQGSTLMTCHKELVSWEVVEGEACWRKNVVTIDHPVHSLCVSDESGTLTASDKGIEKLSQRDPDTIHSWVDVSRNVSSHESSQNLTTFATTLNLDSSTFGGFSPENVVFSASGLDYGVLSRSKDSVGLYYACYRKEITAFQLFGKPYKLIHAELSNLKKVTAIAVCGNQLVVGCGEEGLKLFSII